MATISPQPFPPTGLRPLTKKEVMQRAQALNCTIARRNEPSCSGQLRVGIFFDGTGNNMEVDYTSPAPAARKHSNVVKLFHAFYGKIEDGYFKHYIPGVGTPFPEIGDSATGFWGGAFAWNGEQRVTWAFTRLLNSVHQFVNNVILIDDQRSATISENMASTLNPAFMRRSVLQNWQKTLAQKIKDKKPKVELINLSVYGFSRGSAEARAFCNWLMEVCEEVGGGWEFAGIPIRLSFLGIFDTVASVGIPDSMSDSIVEGHQSWADNNMQIHPAIEQCVHFVAGHEVRAAFPLDSVRVNGVYPANAKEVMYPGAHSDLGGGYPPNAVGISPSNDIEIARIAGANMYKEARLAGVPFLPWGRMRTEDQADLTVSPQTASAFNDYIKAAQAGVGPVEKLHHHHMSLYLSYRYKYRNDIAALPFYRRASAKHKAFIKVTNDTFNKRLRYLTGYPIAPSDPEYKLADAVELHRKFTKAAGIDDSERAQIKHLYDVVNGIVPDKLTAPMESFFGNYVHDSMAGFIDMGGSATNEFLINGLGIWKYRKIFKGND